MYILHPMVKIQLVTNHIPIMYIPKAFPKEYPVQLSGKSQARSDLTVTDQTQTTLNLITQTEFPTPK